MAAQGRMNTAPQPPDISVVLPAFNRVGTIRAAIDSVLSQQGPALELIVVDDASTDATAQVVAGHPDPRIRLIRLPENRGVSAARNAGIAAARADWVAFQDSDDLWLPGKLAAQIAAARPGDVAVYCALRIEDPEGLSQHGSRITPGPDVQPREGALLPALLRANFVSTQTLMVRRAVLERLGGFDTSLPALVDWELMLRLAPLGPVSFVPEAYAVQRFSENSLTRSQSRRAAARTAILSRHADLFATRPAAHAFQLYTAAGEARRMGDLNAARRHLAAARRARPLWWRPHAMGLWLALRRLQGIRRAT